MGEEKLQCFIHDRLLTSAIPFHQPISTIKLKTFVEMAKVRSVRLCSIEVVVHADRSFFSRLLVLAQSRLMDLRHVFSFSLDPVHGALATQDALLAKRAKSTFLDAL